jgi:hypothetical protein
MLLLKVCTQFIQSRTRIRFFQRIEPEPERDLHQNCPATLFLVGNAAYEPARQSNVTHNLTTEPTHYRG